MTISLLYIVVPTILVLVVLISYMNSCKKTVMKEIREIKTQLEKMDNVPVSSVPANMPQEISGETEKMSPVAEKEDESEKIGNEEKKDVAEDGITEPAASTYNTGKSGKIYTKEELELLIKG